MNEWRPGAVEIDHVLTADEAFARFETLAAEPSDDATAVDCVFLDYQLDDTSGLEILRWLRSHGHDVPVIALSANGSEEVAVAALQLEAQDYLVKGGLTPQDIGRSIESAIEQVETARATAARLAELNAFASAVAHDLKAPLRHITLLGEALLEDLDAGALDEVRNHADRIQSCAVRMTAFVTTLLEYARLGRDSSTLVPVDLAQPLQFAVDNLRALIEESGVQVEATALPTVLGDVASLTQLFQNLLGNSIKFRGTDAPRIHVWVERAADEDGFCAITVRDNGVGFDPQYADRAFEPCQRLHGAEYEGSGLGLWICKRIADQHGGQISIDSKPGVGTSVTFTVAAASAAHAPLPATPA